jgi:menaquinone-specific isochorismate synthase
MTTFAAPMPANGHTSVPAEALRSAKGLCAHSFDVEATQLGLDIARAGGAPGRRLLWRKEMTLLGVGEALRVRLATPWPAGAALARQVLSAIRQAKPTTPVSKPAHDVRQGTGLPVGAVAMGALPYDPQAAGHLVVPEVLVALSGHTARVTVVAPKQGRAPSIGSVLERLHEPAMHGPATLTGASPDSFTLTASMPHHAWKQLVERTVSAISAGKFTKVVLARCVEVSANRPFVLHEALARLVDLYPSCAVFHLEGFIGASPETLVRKAGDQVMSYPLAGTVARSGDELSDGSVVAALLSSSKARHEHRVVVDAIATRLRPYCSELDVPSQPSVLALRNVSHLGTLLRGTLLRDAPEGAPAEAALGEPAPASPSALGAAGAAWTGAPEPSTMPTPAGPGTNGGPRACPPSALELAALLQPTPAVGGNPTKAAIEWQRATEGFDRGWYAGPLGWVDSAGDGEWVLGLRSAHVAGDRALLYAGNGIVAGSDPDAELAETQLKLQALLAALVRP